MKYAKYVDREMKYAKYVDPDFGEMTPWENGENEHEQKCYIKHSGVPVYRENPDNPYPADYSGEHAGESCEEGWARLHG